MSLPESPRWHLLKASRLEKRLENRNRPGDRLRIERQYLKAFITLCTLRHTTIQAARDLIYIDAWLRVKPLHGASYDLKEHRNRTGHESVAWLRNWFPNTLELLQQPRCRRAMSAGLIVLALQQLCGVNILAYYSSSVFKDSLPHNSTVLPTFSNGTALNYTQLDFGLDDVALGVSTSISSKLLLNTDVVEVLSRFRWYQFWNCNSSGVPYRLCWSKAVVAHHLAFDGHLPAVYRIDI